MTLATLEPIVSLASAFPPEPVLSLSVAQYHEMVRAGVLEDGAPIELLEGWLVSKKPKAPPYSVSAGCVSDSLADLVGPGWHVQTQAPVTTDASEPEPDIAVVRGRRRDYAERHPAPQDVGLLVEVADASLARDRGWKKRIYAAAGIPIYWLVNLIDRQIEVFSLPSGPCAEPDFAERQVYLPGQQVPVLLDGQEVGRIAVEELLP